jgi:hypothetical protein
LTLIIGLILWYGDGLLRFRAPGDQKQMECRNLRREDAVTAIKSQRCCGLPGNHLINNGDTNRLQHIVSFLLEKTHKQQLQKKEFRVVTHCSTLTMSVLVLRIFFKV